MIIAWAFIFYICNAIVLSLFFTAQRCFYNHYAVAIKTIRFSQLDANVKRKGGGNRKTRTLSKNMKGEEERKTECRAAFFLCIYSFHWIQTVHVLSNLNIYIFRKRTAVFRCVTRVCYARKQDKDIRPARISQLKCYKNMRHRFLKHRNVKKRGTSHAFHFTFRIVCTS